MLAYDRATEETYITGIREATAPDILSRQVTILEKGQKITPLYEATTGLWADDIIVAGKEIKYDPEKTTVEELPLGDGIYLQYIQLQDFRGNSYISPLVQFEMNRGSVTNAAISDEYRAFE